MCAVGGDLLGAVGVPVGRLGVIGVDVRAGGEHRPHGEHAQDDGGDDQTTLLTAFGREDRSRVGGEDGDGGEQGAGRVGELRRLAYLEALDPREAGEARVEPSRDRAGVDDHDGPRRGAARADDCPEPDPELERGDDDEELRELAVLGVDTGRRGVDGACLHRREPTEQHHRHLRPENGRAAAAPGVNSHPLQDTPCDPGASIGISPRLRREFGEVGLRNPDANGIVAVQSGANAPVRRRTSAALSSAAIRAEMARKPSQVTNPSTRAN